MINVVTGVLRTLTDIAYIASSVVRDTQVMSTPQAQFDERYISSREIVRRMGITRPTVSNAVKRKLLPPPIVVSDTLVHLWERAVIEPILASWSPARR